VLGAGVTARAHGHDHRQAGGEQGVERVGRHFGRHEAIAEGFKRRVQVEPRQAIAVHRHAPE